MADQLRFVKRAVDDLHDLVATLDAHADVHRAGRMGDVVLRAQLFEPIRAAAAGRDHDLASLHRPHMGLVAQGDAGTHRAVDQEVLAFRFEQDLDAVVQQVVLDRQIQLLRLFGAQMADRAVDQLQAGLDRLFADIFDLLAVGDALDFLRRAELQIDLVGIVDQALRQVLADQLRQIAAHLVG